MKPKQKNTTPNQTKKPPIKKKNQPTQALKQQKGDNLNFVVSTELVQFFRSQDPRTPICKGHRFKEQNGTPTMKEHADGRLRECRTTSQ